MSEKKALLWWQAMLAVALVFGPMVIGALLAGL